MRLIIVVLLCALSRLATAAPPHQHAPAPVHAHEHGAPSMTLEEQGKRWPADAPLQHAIQQIRNARGQDVRSTADAVALAGAIDDAIEYMILHCSLPADADAALHGVIGQLGGAANALRREDDPRVAITMVDAALERYAQLFDESDLR